MKSNRSYRFAFLLALLHFYGCGDLAGLGPNATAPTFTGNWNLVGEILNPNVLDGNGNPTYTPITSWAFLSQDGTSVSGMVVDNYCLPLESTYPVTGSLNNGQLTLTPSGPPPLPIERFTLSATVSASLNTLQGNGLNYETCASSLPFTVNGQQIASFAGKWAGTVKSVSGPSTTISVNLIEGGPDSSGFPALSGNATISGSPCFTTGAFAGHQIGNTLAGIISTKNGNIQIPQIGGPVANLDSSNQLLITYSVQGGSCNGDNAQGALSRQ